MEKWAKTLNYKKEFAKSYSYPENESIPEPFKPTVHNIYVQDNNQPSSSSSSKPYSSVSKEVSKHAI